MPDELRLSHVDGSGEARMVDVGGKQATIRKARVGARVWMAPATMDLLKTQALPKGDVLTVAKVAGIMAAKRTSELVPLCHPLALTHVDIFFSLAEDEPRLDIECVSSTADRTGVEMEALTGATIAAVTIYDMCKAVDRGMVIGDIRLLEKTGGKEDYVRAGEPASAAPTATATSAAPAGSADVADPPIAAPISGVVPETLPAGSVVTVNVSAGKGERKKPVPEVLLREDHGIVGDGHAGPWHRQVSLLAEESIAKMVAKGLSVGPGDFAENVTTSGIEVAALPVGTTMTMGEALVAVTQIGKECHTRCAIYHQAGDCVMPREGIFVRVIRGGRVAPGDRIQVLTWGAGA
jgi:cyclic pyranopterin phosphate synthase